MGGLAVQYPAEVLSEGERASIAEILRGIAQRRAQFLYQLANGPPPVSNNPLIKSADPVLIGHGEQALDVVHDYQLSKSVFVLAVPLAFIVCLALFVITRLFVGDVPSLVPVLIGAGIAGAWLAQYLARLSPAVPRRMPKGRLGTWIGDLILLLGMVAPIAVPIAFVAVIIAT
jgi:hypothetical protein